MKGCGKKQTVATMKENERRNDDKEKERAKRGRTRKMSEK